MMDTAAISSGSKGQQGPEHERQHGQCPGRADQRFGQHARPLGVAAGLQLSQPGRGRMVARGSADRRTASACPDISDELKPFGRGANSSA